MGTAEKLPELVTLKPSAWSLKVRWALKLHEISYKVTPYTPVFGALWLRWRTGNWSTRVTTPVLFTPDGRALLESFHISEWAEQHSRSASPPRLFPADQLDDIRRWNEKSDIALWYARAQLLQKLQSRPEVLLTVLPPALKALGPLTAPFGRWYLSNFTAKYADLSASTSLDKVKGVLQELRQALKANGGYVLGKQFTYADIVMAVALQVVEPVGPPYSRVPEKQRQELTNQELKAEFGDLLAWREGVLAKHFPMSAA